MSGTQQYWVYHERQEALLCGQHALNNLVQANAFTAESLAEIAQQLDAMELSYMSQNNEGGVNSKDYLKRLGEGSGNVDESGNFSIEVLRSALLSRYDLELPNLLQRGVLDSHEITELQGFICNRASHWFAIRKINGRFWNLNSTLERPELISHFGLAAEVEGLRNQGYSVFCVVDDLPPPCTNESMMDQGLPQYWWKEEDLIKGKSNATTRADDHWKAENVGSGRRLDGKSPSGKSNGGIMGGIIGTMIGGSTSESSLDAMTEEEMLQFAMQASLEQEQQKSENSNENNDGVYELGEEPPVGTKHAVKIQFRLPDGTRSVRRFLDSELVGVLYLYVSSKCSKQRVELRAGFPPKDLKERKGETIADCKLAGEMIQSRYD